LDKSSPARDVFVTARSEGIDDRVGLAYTLSVIVINSELYRIHVATFDYSLEYE